MHLLTLRSRVALALLALLALALVAAACGGDDDEGAEQPDASAQASDEGPAAGASTIPADQAETQTDGDSVSVQNPATSGPAPSEPADGPAAADGDAVGVLYHGTLDDGEVFDSNRDGGQPLRFTLGTGQVIAGFDDAVRGLRLSETVTVRIPPDEAYGDAVLELPREQAPPGLAEGQQVQLGGGVGEVIEVNDDVVRIQNPHRLAGEALTFEIQLVELQ